MRRKVGFTLIELLVVIAIVAILAAILFPVFARARLKAKQAVCQSNLKQLAFAIRMYTDDHDGYGPYNAPCGGLFIPNRLADSGFGPAASSSLYSCPAGGNYGMNRYRGANCAAGGSQVLYPWHIDQGVKHPEAVMLIADAQSLLTGNASYFWNTEGDGLLTPRHLSVNQMAFCDGHVKGVTPAWLKDEIDYADPLTGRGNWFHWTY